MRQTYGLLMVSIRTVVLFLLLTIGPILGYILYAKAVGPISGKAVFVLGYPIFVIGGFFAGLIAAKVAKDEWNWGIAYLAFVIVWGCFALAPFIVLRIPGLTTH